MDDSISVDELDVKTVTVNVQDNISAVVRLLLSIYTAWSQTTAVTTVDGLRLPGPNDGLAA